MCGRIRNDTRFWGERRGKEAAAIHLNADFLIMIESPLLLSPIHTKNINAELIHPGTSL